MSGQALSNVAFVVLLLTLGVLYLLLRVPASGRLAWEALADAPDRRWELSDTRACMCPVELSNTDPCDDCGMGSFELVDPAVADEPAPSDLWDAFDERRCVICRCTDAAACTNPKDYTPCSWVGGMDEDLCTACLDALRPTPTASGEVGA